VSEPGLIVIAEVHGLAGRADELQTLLQELATASESEVGCLSFRLLGPPQAGEFVLLETFDNETSLSAHYETDHYRYYRSKVGELLARPSDVVVHHVSSTIYPRDAALPDPGMLG
jgi:quinol monooxygenase YgiN